MFAPPSTERQLPYTEQKGETPRSGSGSKFSKENHETLSEWNIRERSKTLTKVKLGGKHYKLKERTMLSLESCDTDENEEVDSSKPKKTRQASDSGYSDLSRELSKTSSEGEKRWSKNQHLSIPNKGEFGPSPLPSLKDTNKKENSLDPDEQAVVFLKRKIYLKI